MEKIKNKVLAGILIVLSLLTILTDYYDNGFVPVLFLAIGICAGVTVSIIVGLRVHSYRSRFMGPDHKIWWLTFSSVAAFILVIVFYGLGFDLVTVKLAKSLLIGLSPMLIPILGVGIGLIIRFIKY